MSNDKMNQTTTQDKNAGCYEYESDEEEDVPVFSHKLADVNEHGFAACDEDGLVWKYDRHEDEWRKTESKCDGDCDVCADEEEDYCNGCDTDVAASTMFNHDDINLCPECNKNKPELIPAGCECEDCEKKPETDDFRRFLAIIHPADE
jgi:hypothetical protein